MPPRSSASAAIPASRRCSRAALAAPPPGGDPARAERGARPRQPVPGAATPTSLALSFAGHDAGIPADARDRGHRQSGAPGDRALWRTRPTSPPTGRDQACWCSAARSARACSATSCRRRSRRCRTDLRARLTVMQQCRPEDLDRVRAAYAAGRDRRRAGAVLPRRGGSSDAGASGDRARRRLDRRRTRGRPAGRRSWCRCRARSTTIRPPMRARWRDAGGASVIAQPEFTAGCAGGRD